jgi:hypothetical protein
MRFSPVVVLSFLSAFATANPIAKSELEAEVNTLQARADKWCWLADGYDGVPCRSGAGTAYSEVRKIWFNGPNFGVRCKAYDTRQNTWDYIPGWNCWVQAIYTNSGCESKS